MAQHHLSCSLYNVCTMYIQNSSSRIGNIAVHSKVYNAKSGGIEGHLSIEDKLNFVLQNLKSFVLLYVCLYLFWYFVVLLHVVVILHLLVLLHFVVILQFVVILHFVVILQCTRRKLRRATPLCAGEMCL